MSEEELPASSEVKPDICGGERDTKTAAIYSFMFDVAQQLAGHDCSSVVKAAALAVC